VPADASISAAYIKIAELFIDSPGDINPDFSGEY